MIEPTCPFEVARPVSIQRWDELTFLHWSFEPSAVQRLLPDWLTVDTWEGRAWVGLVPFFMRVSTGGGRSVAWASNFCETNVRTYVHDGRGRTGVWFFSLDAARLGAVVVGRNALSLPYVWSAMSLDRRGDRITYDSTRRWPGPRGARSRVVVDIGTPYADEELGDFDHWLTARWRLFSHSSRARTVGQVWHDPWPLRRAEVATCDDELVAAAGLPAPQEPPIAAYSDGIEVRIERPERTRHGA